MSIRWVTKSLSKTVDDKHDENEASFKICVKSLLDNYIYFFQDTWLTSLLKKKHKLDLRFFRFIFWGSLKELRQHGCWTSIWITKGGSHRAEAVSMCKRKLAWCVELAYIRIWNRCQTPHLMVPQWHLLCSSWHLCQHGQCDWWFRNS